MRYFRKRPSPQQSPEPLVRRFDDGREVCLGSPAGRAEYQRRKQHLWEQQCGACDLASCGLRMTLDDARMTAGEWQGSLRDDRLESNSLVHKRCLAGWHAEHAPAQAQAPAMRPLAVALLVLLILMTSLPACLSAQTPAANAAAISGQINTTFGTPAANAKLRVCQITSVGTPCSTAGVTLYSDAALTHPIANPLSTDIFGNYSVFTTTGLYLLQVAPQLGVTYNYAVSAGGTGSQGQTITLQTNGVPNSQQNLLNLTGGAGITLSNLTGTTTVTNTLHDAMPQGTIIDVVGASNAAGCNAGTCYPQTAWSYLMTLGPGFAGRVTYHNYAASGATPAAEMAQYLAHVQADCIANAGTSHPTLAIIESNVNGFTSSAAQFTATKAIWTQARADGCKVVATTLSDFQQFPLSQAAADGGPNMNAMIRIGTSILAPLQGVNVLPLPYDILIDIYGGMQYDGCTDVTNGGCIYRPTGHYFNGGEFNIRGQLAVAGIATNAILSGSSSAVEYPPVNWIPASLYNSWFPINNHDGMYLDDTQCANGLTEISRFGVLGSGTHFTLHNTANIPCTPYINQGVVGAVFQDSGTGTSSQPIPPGGTYSYLFDFAAGASQAVFYRIANTPTATDIQTVLTGQSGCSTAGYVYSPQSGTCVATGGGGSTTPTGTGFTHVTAGSQDAAARPVNLASADVTGALPNANLASPSVTINSISCTLGGTCTVPGTVGPGTARYIPSFATTSTLGNSHIDDGATTSGVVTVTEPLAVATGSSVGGGVGAGEGTAASAATGVDNIWADSTAHRFLMNFNGVATNYFVPGVVTAGTSGHCPQFAANGIDLVDSGAACGSGGGGSGTVTSVAQTAPSSLLTVSGSPVTSSGTLALGLATAAAYSLWGNAGSSSATPGYTANPVVNSLSTAGSGAGYLGLGVTPGSYDVYLQRTAAGALACGSTSGGTNCALTLGSVNGVALTAAGSSSSYLNGAGGYTDPLQGKALPSGAIVGTTDTQTLTNKAIDAGEITTGVLATARGGTGAGPLTGVRIANGSSADTAVTAPVGAIVGTTDTQSLTNKTVNGVTLTATGSANQFLNAAGSYATPTNLVARNFTWSVTAPTSQNTYLGPIYYTSQTVTFSYYAENSGAGTSCSNVPTFSVRDLGTSANTAFSSSTQLWSGLSNIGGNGGGSIVSFTVPAGHFVGFGVTGGTCTGTYTANVSFGN